MITWVTRWLAFLSLMLPFVPVVAGDPHGVTFRDESSSKT